MATLDPVDARAAETFALLAVEMHDAGGIEETVSAVMQFALTDAGL